MPQAREISLRWDKPNHRSRELFNVPLDSIIKLNLFVEARTSDSFYVIINEPQSSWLNLSKTTDKVPFRVAVTIDTTGLLKGQGYKEVLEFRSMGELIYTEPVYLTTKIYDSEQLVTETYVVPLNAGKPRRNPFRSVLNAVVIVYHMLLTVVYLWVGLVIIILILAIVVSAFQG